VELADVVVINKSDIDPAAARIAALQFGGAQVVSALRGEGIAELWSIIEKLPRRTRVAPNAAGRPFRILGVQQIAIGAMDKQRLRHLWVDLLGLMPSHQFRSDAENVDEDILRLGHGSSQVEFDLMQPLDPEAKPTIQTPALNHLGLWVDDLQAAMSWLQSKGLRFAPGGIRKGASGHDVCFIHPRANEEFALSGEGVLIELVQAPPDVIAALR
jgi:lactoylglutathione lyase